MSFTAKYPGDCENCDVPVKEGDECRMLDYEKGLIAHVVCPTPRPTETSQACPKCFLVHAPNQKECDW